VGLGGAIAGTACCAPTEAKPHTPRKKKRAGRMPALRKANGACLPVDAFRTKRRALQMKNARVDSSRCSLREAQGKQDDNVGAGRRNSGHSMLCPYRSKTPHPSEKEKSRQDAGATKTGARSRDMWRAAVSSLQRTGRGRSRVFRTGWRRLFGRRRGARLRCRRRGFLFGRRCPRFQFRNRRR